MVRPASRIASSSVLELVARHHAFDSGGLHCFVAGVESGAEHHGLAALVARVEEEFGAMRPAVDHQDRPRLHHARYIEELIRLAQRLLSGAFGGALDDGHRVADLRHHPRAPRGIFFGRKDIGEHGLRRQREAPARATQARGKRFDIIVVYPCQPPL